MIFGSRPFQAFGRFSVQLVKFQCWLPFKSCPFTREEFFQYCHTPAQGPDGTVRQPSGVIVGLRINFI